MATKEEAINSYRNAISRYNAMKANLNSMVSELNLSKGSIENFSSTLNEVYSLDDNDSILCTKVKNIREDISTTSSFIKNNVIPAIDRAIIKCHNKIAEIGADS